MSYILIVDDEPDLIDMLELITSSVARTRTYKASSGNDALELIKNLGAPCLIISDYRMPNGDGFYLYTELQKLHPGVPFVVCSGTPRDQLGLMFSGSSLFIEKPNILKPLKQYLEHNFKNEKNVIEYVQLPLGYLKRLGVLNFDTFVRLNENKYIKIHQAGDALDRSDYEKLEIKFLNRLYLQKSDALTVVREFEDFLSKRSLGADELIDDPEFIDTVIPSVALLCKCFGWSEESIKLAKRTVTSTLQYVKKNKSWSAVIRLPSAGDNYSSHISLLAILTCVVASNLGWHNETTHEKLVLASLMHDHFVDESAYDDFTLLIIENLNPSSVLEYRNHPSKAAELARSLRGIPSSVDSIILEHHELPGGGGFPRGLNAGRISALGALFIICEAIIAYSFRNNFEQISIADFISTHPEFTQKDPFKKILLSLKN